MYEILRIKNTPDFKAFPTSVHLISIERDNSFRISKNKCLKEVPGSNCCKAETARTLVGNHHINRRQTVNDGRTKSCFE